MGVSGSTSWGGRESTIPRQMPISVRPSCAVKSLKSLTFQVARGRS